METGENNELCFSYMKPSCHLNLKWHIPTASTFNLKTVLPKFYQHVNFATTGVNTLDLAYTNIRDSYKAAPQPCLIYSDHIPVMPIPVYRPIVKWVKLVLKQIRLWPAGATSALQVQGSCHLWTCN